MEVRDQEAMGGLLEGKKVLVTGVLDRRSIAYSAARLTQEQGLRSSLAASAAPEVSRSGRPDALDPEPPILELDVNKPEDIEAAAHDLKERWGTRRIVHAIAFAPEEALGATSSPQSGPPSPPPSRPRPTL